MGGKDDRSSDLDKWIETQRKEINKLRDELLGQGSSLEKDIRSWTEDVSTSVRSPFERFKNFVDSNFSTLSEGFRNFPNNISELKDRMQQEREARREEEKDISRRWTGSEDSPDHIRMQIERSTSDEREASRDAVNLLLRTAYEKNKHVPAHKILELYRDNEWKFGGLDKFANPMLSFGGACYYKPETVENLPSTARWGWPASNPQWLSVDWFKRSPYSPIRLEAYPNLADDGSKWRAAFEDLLSVALDKPMISEEKVGIRQPNGKPQSTYYGPGLEWMLSLQCRGILPPQLPSMYRPVSLFDGFDEVNRPRSAYFWHDIAQMLDSKSAKMYPLVKRDMEALIDEVSIKSGPENEASPLRQSYAVAPWRVPDTEQELYEEMPPIEKRWKTLPPPTPEYDEYFDLKEELREYLESSELDEAADLLTEYFEEFGRVGELVGDTLDELAEEAGAEMDMHAMYKMHEALRRSDVPLEEQTKVMNGQGCPWAHLADELKERAADDRRNAKEETRASVPLANTPAPTQRPDILAQLTTTQRTRMPDGTVTTKVVLKQRFADGREEEHESVHTSHEPLVEAQEKKTEESKRDKKQEKKGGWFWS